MKSKFAFSFITPNASSVTGLSSYAESLIHACATGEPGKEFTLFTNAQLNILPRLQNIANLKITKIGNRKIWPYKLHVLWLQFLVNFMAARSGCRVLVSCTSSGSIFPLIPQFFTIHDIYELKRAYSSRSVVAYTTIVWQWLTIVSKGILCDSETTRRAAIARIAGVESKSRVILAASKFSPTQPKPANLKFKRFLFVANVQKTKNVECLLEALLLGLGTSTDLSTDWIGGDPVGIVRNWLTLHHHLENFHPLGRVTDEVLAEAYGNCYALIVPSFDEGFCLPVLEAQASGVPVVASDIPILREIAGDGGLFFDPNKPESLLEKLLLLRNDHRLWGALSEKAKENVRRFSWGKAAAELKEFVG